MESESVLEKERELGVGSCIGSKGSVKSRVIGSDEEESELAAYLSFARSLSLDSVQHPAASACAARPHLSLFSTQRRRTSHLAPHLSPLTSHPHLSPLFSTQRRISHLSPSTAPLTLSFAPLLGSRTFAFEVKSSGAKPKPKILFSYTLRPDLDGDGDGDVDAELYCKRTHSPCFIETRKELIIKYRQPIGTGGPGRVRQPIGTGRQARAGLGLEEKPMGRLGLDFQAR
ncbi:hypothetical protein FCM35_KLT06726 [Carex littledalei]|uniref:Uncharacterized protein n=1 Tax=Carex littledalei TaxID=544730 RepID=A0A833QK63_9POAL|nr:hypothetical protein FCM35_KLT06726 [Carex littledalei]